MAKKDFAAQVGGVIDLYEPEDGTAEKGTHTASTPDDEKGGQTVDTPGDDLSDSEGVASTDTPKKQKKNPMRYTIILDRRDQQRLKMYATYNNVMIKDLIGDLVRNFLDEHKGEFPEPKEV